MPNLPLKSLVAKLNPISRRTLEAAAGFCLSRTNYHVEIEHWLVKLLEEGHGDLPSLLNNFDVEVDRLKTAALQVVDGLKSGNGRSPSLGPQTIELIQAAWMLASVEFGSQEIRSGHLLAAIIRDPLHMQVGTPVAKLLDKVSGDQLTECFLAVTKNSPESVVSYVSTNSASGDVGTAVNPNSKTPNLDRYTIDLTEQARSGKMDPVLGRDVEIRQLMDILLRRRQNNPILTGEPGVGKTAVVEGFAQRIAAGDVPPALANVALRSLDLGLLEAGASVKGEFENRLKSILSEIAGSPTPIILFIDEAHTLIGAGGQAGGGDAANLLKPALARGKLRTIAATTWAEYKKYFEQDAALTRRFQVVKVEEPSEDTATAMLRGIAKTLERHHGVRILDEAIVSAVKLSSRYITGRQLPDKAVSVLDTACARIAISQNSTPGVIEDARRRREELIRWRDRLIEEGDLGDDHAEELADAATRITAIESECQAFENRWNQELELVRKIKEISKNLVATKNAMSDSAATEPLESVAFSHSSRQELCDLEEQLDTLHEESPLVYVNVDQQAVAATISAWTGIPLGKMSSDQTQAVLHLRERMEESVVGQSHALDEIARQIRTSRAGLGDPQRPIGVFLLCGTSGVGKTETALTLADTLYGGNQHLTTINMTEFKEEHKVSLLMGSPPGYVGYGEGGILTEAVRRKPYSVVLLDEMEKAHHGIQDVFYQVFDKGNMKDGQGRDIDFKNTVIIMTTNAGTDLITQMCQAEERPSPSKLKKALHEELLKTFKPAFLGRVSVIPFFPLDMDTLKNIVGLKLGKVVKRMRENHRAQLQFTARLIDFLGEQCLDVDTGARKADQIINNWILPELSAELLERAGDESPVRRVTVDYQTDGGFIYDFETDADVLQTLSKETNSVPVAPITAVDVPMTSVMS